MIYYRTKQRYNTDKADGISTAELVEHIAISNEYATLKDDQFGDESGVHLGFQVPEALTIEVVNSANEVSTSSDTNKENTNTSAITVP